MRKPLVDTLMEGGDLSRPEAEKLVQDCRKELHERIADGDMPFDICEEHFGLEPDYLDDLM